MHILGSGARFASNGLRNYITGLYDGIVLRDYIIGSYYGIILMDYIARLYYRITLRDYIMGYIME